jgi:hypothetical protein
MVDRHYKNTKNDYKHEKRSVLAQNILHKGMTCRKNYVSTFGICQNSSE